MFEDEELIVGTKVVVHSFWRRFTVTFFTVLVLGFVAGFVYFAMSLETRKVSVAMTPVADGIVALTGGKERLKAGFDLLLAQKGKRLLISGVGAGNTIEDLRTELGVGNTMPEVARFGCCVDLDHSTDTIGNAAAAARWAKAQSFNSLVIVTSAYHMPRALAEFRAAMPGTVLQAHPVQSDAVRVDQWWAFPGTAMLLVQEYVKTLAASARAAFAKQDM